VSDTNSWSATLQLEHAVGTVLVGCTPMGCLRYFADPGSLVARTPGRSLNTLHSWQNL
jgi:hypothetical protein